MTVKERKDRMELIKATFNLLNVEYVEISDFEIKLSCVADCVPLHYLTENYTTNDIIHSNGMTCITFGEYEDSYIFIEIDEKGQCNWLYATDENNIFDHDAEDLN